MAVEIYMPKNGMDMTEGTLIRWLKNVGDHVEQGEPIMEIETDKVTMESEAPAAGTLLKKLYKDGDVVPVLTTIGYIGAPDELPPENTSPSAAAPAKDAAPDGEEGDTYDVAVIGGGPAGYVAAIRAAQLGARVVLFEKDTVGGTCLNRGCIPTKTFLKTAEYMHHIKNAASRGIRINGAVSVNMPEVIRCKNKVVKTLTDGVAALLRSNGVLTVNGEARLLSPTSIACGGTTYHTKKVILCGGSKAVRIPIPGIDSKHVLTSTEILNLPELPETLCIIGGGVIGCEFASAFQSFGSKVVIVEQMNRLAAIMDQDVSAEIEKCMRKEGVEIHLGEGVQEIVEKDGRAHVVTDTLDIACDKILLSIGRVPDTDCLGALKDQIRTEKGRVLVDDTMKTSVDTIYACGDINGRAMLAHTAFKMGEAAAENCVNGTAEPCDLKTVPNVIYTLPEAACVGLTEAQAREQYPDGIRIGKFPMAANGRSVASGETEGFVKVITDAKYGEILGVHIVGASAAEMIAEPASLISSEVTVHEVVSKMIHAHPSYEEAFAEACGDALNRCIHLPAKK